MIWKIACIGAEFSFLHLTDACDRQWLYFDSGHGGGGGGAV